MSKIRINELARELEVKPSRILELLPELGVAEKKTHSSSLDEDIALRVRRLLHDNGEIGDHPAANGESGGEPAAVAEAPAAVVAAPPPASGPQSGSAAAQPEPPAEPRAAEPAPAASEIPATPIQAPVRPPLRPPLSAGGSAAAPPPRPAVPPPPAAAGPAGSLRPPLAGIPAARPAPAAPAPRPGQILSGPRQPLPAELGEMAKPAAPAPRQVPSIPTPRPAAPRPPAPAPGTPAPGPAAASTAQPGTPAPRPALAGQPAARPVVPPRPDIVARLQQRPGAPAIPRPSPGGPTPGAATPGRPSASPRPGQPIYTGPVRPGQPLMRGPGMPGPGGPRRPGGRMHPTSSVRLEPPTPLPADQPRRHTAKPGARVERTRDEEGKLRPAPRRTEPAPLPAVNREITISEGVTVKELSEKLGVKANLVIKKLVEKKIFATINQTLDVKMAEELAREFGASTQKISYEEETTHEIQQTEVEVDRVRRAPVVTIMGHVDHGKTSLLDAIRSANVAAKEAGGITQHIGAYQVEKNNRKIVFIDTPGHEAFTRMRARGAKVTDIVILVVAADDGVMPQTLEAIDHARAAGVPIIVAINKIDKPDAQPERIKQQLADRGLLAEDWGGDVVMVPVSAKAQTNLDLLLEMILLVADMQDLKANPARPGMGNVLEAKLDKGRGPVATVLVRNGTMRVGDYFICGSVFGKVRAMFNDWGEPIREAEPSTPVEILGLEALPEVGDTFQVVTDTAKAKQIVMYRETKAREVAMAKTRITLDQLHSQLREGETKELNIIIKSDVGGSAEVLSETLQKLSNEKVKIRVIHTGVGAITETDVLLASASEAIIIGFNVRPERNAAALAEQEKVDIRLHTIIYNLTDEIKRAMSGLLEPVFKEVYKGRAEVRETFRISKVGTVAGCMVVDGAITRDAQVRILRDNVVIHTGKIDALKRFKNDASEVKQGFECGISIVNFNDVKPGDIIEAFVTEKVAQEAFA
jgi:translation initiation factor IF-2